MRLSFVVINVLLMGLVVSVAAQENFETDTIKTSAGDLKIMFLGHGTLIFTFAGKIIHVDPYSKMADAAKAFTPKILYPYHYGETNTSKLLDLLKDTKGIEVRIRNMK